MSEMTAARPAGGSLEHATGVSSWTPGYDQSGSYSPVTFSVTDGTDTDSETIEITVSNVNRAPVLGSIGDRTVAEGSSLSFTLSATDAEVTVILDTFLRELDMTEDQIRLIHERAASPAVAASLREQRQIVEEEIRTLKIPTLLISSRRYDGVVSTETLRKYSDRF